MAAASRTASRTASARRPVTDHRVLVGRRRRAQMTVRIMETALDVFAEKGPDAPVIDDFVRAAGIARGTFYNHFETVQKLLEAVVVWALEKRVAAIDQHVRAFDDPLVRFGMGIRIFLRRAQLDVPWCRFVAKTWKLGELAQPRRHLAEARRRALIRVPDLEAAFEVVRGGIREAMLQMTMRKVPQHYPDQVATVCLQALGAPPAHIAAILRIPLPPDQALTSARSGSQKPGRWQP